MKISFPKTSKNKVVAACFLILFFAFMTVLAQRVYIYFNPQTLVNYKIFKPSYLPNGMSATETVIRAETPSSLLWWVTPDVDVKFYLNEESSYFNEVLDSKVPTCDSLYSSPYLKCEARTTPSGVAYIRSLVYYPTDYNTKPLVYDNLSQESVYFIKDSTGIMFSISSTYDQPISLDEWDKTIDSFQEVELTNYTILHAHPGP